MSACRTESRLEKVMRAGHLGVTSECGPPGAPTPQRSVKRES